MEGRKGGVENGWQTVLRSEDIYGPYDYRIVMHQGNTDINGPHQGGYIELDNGDGYFMHFQDRGPYGRVCHLQPVSWTGGWPFIGQEQNGDGIGEPVSEWQMPACGVNLPDSDKEGTPVSDDFEMPKLGLQWQWQANPSDSWYSLQERPGYLRLYTLNNTRREENLLWYAPNVCSQLLHAPGFAVTAKLELHPKTEGDFCGLGMLGHVYSYLGLAFRNGKYLLELRAGKVIGKQGEGQAEEEVVWSSETDSGESESSGIEIGLVLSEDSTYRYFICRDSVFIPGIFRLDRGTWTGARLALVSLNTENRMSGGAGDFEYIHFYADCGLSAL